MANTLFDIGRRLMLQAGVDWANVTLKCCLVDTGAYTPNFSAHQYLSDIGESARNFGSSGAAGVLLANATVQSNGAADGDDVRFVSVAGATVEAVVIYMDVGGVAANSPLIFWMDTATGLPITPNGGDIIVSWDNGTNRIFRP